MEDTACHFFVGQLLLFSCPPTVTQLPSLHKSLGAWPWKAGIAFSACTAVTWVTSTSGTRNSQRPPGCRRLGPTGPDPLHGGSGDCEQLRIFNLTSLNSWENLGLPQRPVSVCFLPQREAPKAAPCLLSVLQAVFR